MCKNCVYWKPSIHIGYCLKSQDFDSKVWTSDDEPIRCLEDFGCVQFKEATATSDKQ